MFLNPSSLIDQLYNMPLVEILLFGLLINQTFCIIAHILAARNMIGKSLCLRFIIFNIIIGAAIGLIVQLNIWTQIIDGQFSNTAIFFFFVFGLVTFGDLHKYSSIIMFKSLVFSFIIQMLNTALNGFIFHTASSFFCLFALIYMNLSLMTLIMPGFLKRVESLIKRLPEVPFISVLIPDSLESKNISLKIHSISLTNLYYMTSMTPTISTLITIFAIAHTVMLLYLIRDLSILKDREDLVDEVKSIEYYFVSSIIEIPICTSMLCEQVSENYDPSKYSNISSIGSYIILTCCIFASSTAFAVDN